MTVKMNVLQRWNLVSVLPEKGGLHTQLIVQKLREKLLIDSDEMEALGMITGIIHEECGSPVENRGTEDEERIQNRLAKAEKELSYAKCFDIVIINDDLKEAQQNVLATVKSFLKNWFYK